MLNDTRRDEGLLPIIAAAVVGVAGTAAALWIARRRDGRVHPGLERSRLERSVRDILREDETLSRRGMLVSEIGPGVVELAGIVETAEEMQRAVAGAQKVDGVTTVVNRLTIRTEESRLAATRSRFADGDPSLTETHWTGMGVGMGRRRQSPETDPDRRDDHVRMIERELAASRVAADELNGLGEGEEWDMPLARERRASERDGRELQ